MEAKAVQSVGVGCRFDEGKERGHDGDHQDDGGKCWPERRKNENQEIWYSLGHNAFDYSGLCDIFKKSAWRTGMAGISQKSTHSEGCVAVLQVFIKVWFISPPLCVTNRFLHLCSLNVCTLTPAPQCWVVNALSPVVYKRREESPWKPQSVRHRQHPEDGQLVQHLANETKSHVEVRGEKTCDKINDSETACSSVNGIF